MKMARSEISVTVATVAVVVVMVASCFVEAQEPDCASKLGACGEFMKSNNPPASCCNPIKEVVATQLDCLCNLYTSGVLSTIGINITDALHLTKACGVSNDLSKCNKISAPAPQQGSPPAVPGNDAEKLVLTGFTSLFLLLASLIFY